MTRRAWRHLCLRSRRTFMTMLAFTVGSLFLGVIALLVWAQDICAALDKDVS